MDSPYGKGCIVTFETEENTSSETGLPWDYQYILPREAVLIQQSVAEACDRMEYAGSPMYDQYPDRVTIQGVAEQICGNRGGDSMLQALVEVLLCQEMGCRRSKCCEGKCRPPKNHR